jgi:lipopolysaccharide transport system ATP-binding protein
MEQPVKTYSSGMYVRLAFAVATCLNPNILIVDEALSVGDAIFQSRSYRRMEEMRDSGKTIILVTHDFYTVQSFCDRAILLDNGQVLKMGEAKPVVNKYLQLISIREKEYIETLTTTFGKSPTSLSTYETTSNPDNVIEQETIQQEFRFGSRQAEIIGYYLLNEADKETLIWESGTFGTVVIIVKFYQKVDCPIIAFGVTTPTGINVFGTNSWYAENEPGPQTAGTILKAEFRQVVRLNPGNYILGCSVTEKKADYLDPLDKRIDTIAFKVIGTKKYFSGLVDMETQISYKIQEESE